MWQLLDIDLHGVEHGAGILLQVGSDAGVGLGKGGDELGVEIVSSAGSRMDRSCDRGSVMAGSG